VNHKGKRLRVKSNGNRRAKKNSLGKWSKGNSHCCAPLENDANLAQKKSDIRQIVKFKEHDLTGIEIDRPQLPTPTKTTLTTQTTAKLSLEELSLEELTLKIRLLSLWL